MCLLFGELGLTLRMVDHKHCANIGLCVNSDVSHCCLKQQLHQQVFAFELTCAVNHEVVIHWRNWIRNERLCVKFLVNASFLLDQFDMQLLDNVRILVIDVADDGVDHC